MATLAYIAGVYTFLLFGWTRAATNLLDVSDHRRDLDRRDDLDLLRRDRALGPHAVLPARRSRSSPWPCSRSSRWSRSTPAIPPRLDPRRARLVQPVRDPGLQRPGRRRPARGVHLLGLGHRACASTRSPRTPASGPGKAAVSAPSCWSAIYVVVAVAAQAYGGLEFLTSNQDDVLSALGERRPRLAARQAADHRGADLGLGVDADDDPARPRGRRSRWPGSARSRRCSAASTRAT